MRIPGMTGAARGSTVAILMAGLAAMAAAPPAPGPLRLLRTIPLPDVEGRIDHLAIDLAGRRLFVCALGNGSVEVVDLEAGARTQSVAGFEEPQGARYLPDTATLVVASGGDGAATFLEGTPLRRAKSVPVGGDADNVRLDAGHGTLYVGVDGGLAVLDPRTRTRLALIPLDGHAESFQLDGRRIYVNIPQRQEVAVVDLATKAVVARWPVSAAGNYPMALDAEGHRLMVATRRPPRLLVLDTETGHEVAAAGIGGDADDLYLDAARHRLYALCGEGQVTVLSRSAGDRYEVVARVPTAAGARTGLFVPELGRLYVAVPRRAGPTAEIRDFEAAP